MKYWLIPLCTILLFGIERLHNFQNGGFRVSKLHSSSPSLLDPPPKEIDALLEQRFHYFGKGGTSFVFLGEDGKTILKLFKHQHLSAKSVLFQIVLPGVSDVLRIEKIVQGKKKRAHKHHSFFLNSCALAHRELKEQTGLLYLCPKPNPHFTKQVELVDSWGVRHEIALSGTEFAIQKRAELFFPYLEGLLKAGQREKCWLAICSLLEQVRHRCSKGIGDRDPNLGINFGFIDGKAVEFDLGSYFLDPKLKHPLAQKRELFLVTHALQKWLEKHSPDLVKCLLAEVTR